jgi:predicted methyltransferase
MGIRTLLGVSLFVITLHVVADSHSSSARLQAVINADHRSQAYVLRDTYRHPAETLAFFGLEPNMTIVEIWPSSGWYTEILAPFVRGTGIYYGAGYSMTAERTPKWRQDYQKKLSDRLAESPDVYDHIVFTELSVPERTTIAPPGTVDMVFTFRNVHNWMGGDYAEEMFQVFNRALKPGGVLALTEHRALPGTSLAEMKKSGYVTEELVIAMANKAGFVLEARSEINANPKDTHDHPAGVWTLPPGLRHCGKLEGNNKTACEAKYRSIGESDRMTLRFRKPKR